MQRVEYNGVLYDQVLFDRLEYANSGFSVKLANCEQTIAGVRQLLLSSIDEMVERKHDLDHQLGLCRQMMQAGDILPYPFERAVILLRKAKRFDEELEICRYVRSWCLKAEQEWNGRSWKQWTSPPLQRCIVRILKIEALIRTKY